jgi:hypothetical protein
MVLVLTNYFNDDNGNQRKLAVDFSKVTQMVQYDDGSKIFTFGNHFFIKENLEEIADKLNSLYSRYNNTLNVYYKPSKF